MIKDIAMSKRVAVLLADGFEEAEAVAFIDIMRRLDIRLRWLALCRINLLFSSSMKNTTCSYRAGGILVFEDPGTGLAAFHCFIDLS